MKLRTAKELQSVIEAARDKKATQMIVFNVHPAIDYTETILVCSGRSERQVKAIADGIIQAMKATGARPLGIEGLRDGQWTLIDFGNLVVHVFHEPVREFYELERLWSDCQKTHIPDEGELPALTVARRSPVVAAH